MKQLCLAVFLLFVAAAGYAQVSANGTISAQGSTCATTNACVTLQLVNTLNAGSGGVAFVVSANASANTLQFEGSGDGVTWVALNATPYGSTTAVTSTTSTGTWQANVAGLVAVRVRCSTFVSGTATIAIQASTASARSGGGSGGGGGVTCGTDACRVTNAGVTTAYPAANYGSATAALLAACGAITNGDNLYLAGETFDLGSSTDNGCDLSQSGTVTASIHGAGPLTVIQREYVQNGNFSPIITPGLNHSRITDLNIVSAISPGSSHFEIPISNRLHANPGNYFDVTDLGIERVNITGVSDCVIINPISASSGYMRNYTCTTQWDGMTQTGNGGTLTWTMDDTQTNVTPDSTNVTGTCYKMSESTGGSVFTLQNSNACIVTNSNSAATVRALDTEGSGTGPVTITAGPGLRIDTSGDTAGTVYDLNLGMSGTTLNLTSGVVYNAARVNNSRGTMNFCQDQFSCPQQVTGGIIGSSGSGASTWTNAAVAPFSDAGSSVFAAAPFSFFLVNPTLTTSNGNGSAGLQVQLDTNLGASPTRVQWIAGIAPGAVAGVYRNTSLLPYQIAAGQPFSSIGVNSIPTNGTALATVRGLTYNMVGTQNTLLGAYVGATIPASGTRFVGFSNTLQSTETTTQTVMATAYSISGFCVYTSAGAAGNFVITLRKAAADTGLILTIPTSGALGVWCTTGTAVTGSAGDLLDWKLVNNDASNPTGSVINLIAQDAPTAPATGQLTFGLGSSTLTSNQNNYAPPFSGVATSTTQLNNEVGLPRAVTIKNLYCRANTCPGTNDASFTVQKNGVSTSLTMKVLHTDTCPETVSDTTDVVSFAAGDTINLIENQPTSGTAAAIASCSVEHD